MHTQTHVTARMRKKREKESHVKRAGPVEWLERFRQVERGFIWCPPSEERSPGGETSVRPTRDKNGFDLTVHLQMHKTAGQDETTFVAFSSEFQPVLTGEGGFAKLR